MNGGGVEKAVGHFEGLDKQLPVGVALSGGADSVALAMALSEAGYSVVALHVNFNLRGEESDGDADFCRRLAKSRGWNFRELNVKTTEEKRAGESIEMTCRRLRYEWFERTAEAEGLQAVAVAHHRDDMEETMLLNLLRGTGVAGLRAMKPRRGIFIRPLLGVTRREIESYLKEKGAGYRTDSTNRGNDYRRNALRNVILPAIREYFPDADKGLLTTMANMAEVDGMIDKEVERNYAERFDGRSLVIKGIDNSDLLVRLAERCFPPGINHSVAKDILNDTSRNNAVFNMRDGRELLLYDGALKEVVEKADESAAVFRLVDGTERPVAIRAEIIDKAEFESRRKSRSEIYLDADEARGERATLRRWRQGDRLSPYGMAWSRLVSDLLKEARLDLNSRREVYVVEDSKGRLLWVVGIRGSRHYRVTEKTSKVLVLQIVESQKNGCDN